MKRVPKKCTVLIFLGKRWVKAGAKLILAAERKKNSSLYLWM